MTLSEILLTAATAIGGSLGTLIAQSVERRYRKEEKKDDRELADAKLLHETEVEFRRALLERVRDLERHDREKSRKIEEQAARIAELTDENTQLKAKIERLEARP